MHPEPSRKTAEFCDGKCKQETTANWKVNSASSNPKAASTPSVSATNSMSLDSDHGGSETNDSDSSDQNSVVFDLAEHQNISDQASVQILDYEALAKVLSDQNKGLSQQWQEQVSVLAKSLRKSHDTPSFPSNTSIPLPRFSGGPHEGNFNRVATFYKLSPARKAETLPLMLSGNAAMFLHTTPDLAGKSFDVLAEALRKQFHSESDAWISFTARGMFKLLFTGT